MKNLLERILGRQRLAVANTTSRAELVTGPARIEFQGGIFFSQNSFEIRTEKNAADIASEKYGRIDAGTMDARATVTVTLLGEVENLGTLFPLGRLPIGGSPFGRDDSPLVIWGSDETKYTLHNAAVVEEPAIRRSSSKTPLGAITFAALRKDGADPSDADAIMTIATGQTPPADTELDPEAILVGAPDSSLAAAGAWADFDTKDGWEVRPRATLADVPSDQCGIIDMRLTAYEVEARAMPRGVASTDALELPFLQGAGATRGGRASRTEDLVLTGGGGTFTVRLKEPVVASQGGTFASVDDRRGEVVLKSTRRATGGYHLGVWVPPEISSAAVPGSVSPNFIEAIVVGAKVYLIPFANPNVVIVDTRDMSVSSVALPTPVPSGAYRTASLVGGRYIVCPPTNGADCLKIDTADDSVTEFGAAGLTGGGQPTNKFFGSCSVREHCYATGYGYNGLVRLDPVAETATHLFSYGAVVDASISCAAIGEHILITPFAMPGNNWIRWSIPGAIQSVMSTGNVSKILGAREGGSSKVWLGGQAEAGIVLEIDVAAGTKTVHASASVGANDFGRDGVVANGLFVGNPNQAGHMYGFDTVLDSEVDLGALDRTGLGASDPMTSNHARMGDRVVFPSDTGGWNVVVDMRARTVSKFLAAGATAADQWRPITYGKMGNAIEQGGALKTPMGRILKFPWANGNLLEVLPDEGVGNLYPTGFGANAFIGTVYVEETGVWVGIPYSASSIIFAK